MARRQSTRQLTRVSSSRMTVTQRFRRSWESWSLTRTRKRQAKAERRLQLLQLETTHQLLLLKELEAETRRLEHRQREIQQAAEWYQNPQPEPTAQPTVREILEGSTLPPSQTTGEQ